jgi:hypothetical protein
MAAIRNVTLTINKLDEMKSEVIVEYDLIFSRAEIQAGSIFVERVGLRGADVVNDDELAPALMNQLVQAEEDLPRRAVRRVLPNQLLDEDRDRGLLGMLLGREDEVYAQVSMVPFMPRPAMGRSATLRAQLGPAGEP